MTIAMRLYSPLECSGPDLSDDDDGNAEPAPDPSWRGRRVIDDTGTPMPDADLLAWARVIGGLV